MTTDQSLIIIYGSYGYTGRLIAEACMAQKLPVLLAGRDRAQLQQQHGATGLPFEVADLRDREALEQLLRRGRLVIHCAGPFEHTAQTMVDMCLRTRTHYVDITGEYKVFEQLALYDARAREAGIMVLPGAGFDVVPSDCLAQFLKFRLPSATHLMLAFAMGRGGISRGTARTMIAGLGAGSMVREDGILRSVPMGMKTMEVDFGRGPVTCLNIPWGDVSTAWHSTAIPNIEVYAAAPAAIINSARIIRYLDPLLRWRPLKNYLLKKVAQRPAGPSAKTREAGKGVLWGRVYDHRSGNAEEALLQTPNGYTLTALASALIAEKIVSGNFVTGFQTPSKAYGHNLILEIAGTRLTLLR